MTKKLTKDRVFGKAETLTIGDRIRQLRGKEPRKSLCEALEISLSALINYENNSRTPDARLIVRLCEIYNVTTDWLILGKDTRCSDLVDSINESAPNEQHNTHSNNQNEQPNPASKKDWASDLNLTEFECLWDEYRSEREARRGWLQVEVIKRFPEFIEWLEQRQDPLRPAQIAALKKREQLLHYGLPNQLEDD